MRILQAAKVRKLEDYLFLPDDELEVNQGEWRQSSGILSTLAVASCVALAAHNRITKQGILGHFSSISPTAQHSPFLAEEHFDEAAFSEATGHISGLGPASATTVWLGGAALQHKNPEPIREAILADRDYATARIREVATKSHISNESVTTNWNGTDYQLYLRLDCATGSLLILPLEE